MQVDGDPPTQEWEGQDPGAAPEPAADSSDAPPPEDNLICQAIDLSRYPTLFGLDLPVVCKDPYKAMPFVGGAEKVTRAYRGETKKIFVSPLHSLFTYTFMMEEAWPMLIDPMS